MLTRSEIFEIAEIVAAQLQEAMTATSIHKKWLTMKEVTKYANVKSVNTTKKFNENHSSMMVATI